jgi:hypothetical protein
MRAHMSPLAQTVAGAVHQASPHGTCFACLAAQQGLHEHDVRAAALVLIVRAGLELVRQTCHWCGRTDDVLVSRTAE